MSDLPTGASALAGALYATLGWQLVLLAVVALLVAWVRVGRGSAATPGTDDEPQPEPAGRRVLRISLGVLWVVDGLLQAQPAMPARFVPQVVAPGLDAAPGWLSSLAEPLLRVWTEHPVPADAVTVWVQVGIGVALLAGGTRGLARLGAYVSVGWGLVVWVFGELLGGLAERDASWLTGAPGAALLYVAAAVLLLVPLDTWPSGAAPRWGRRVVGATLLAGAALEALPRSGSWTSAGLFRVFSDVANGGVPAPAAAPVQWLATWVAAHPTAATLALVAVPGVVGVGLLVGVFPRTLSATAALVCAFGWWFGQGFGVFGGVGTDPNSGLVLLVLLAACWPRTAVVDPTAAKAVHAAGRPPGGHGRLRVVVGSLAVVALLVLPLAAGLGLLGPQTAQAAIGDSGGVVATDPQPAPDFTLTDQDGRQVAMHDLRGKLVLLAFLDPECTDSCPLIANQLATSVRALGSAGGSVAVLAVDVNPVFNRVEDVRTFTDAHGLGSLAGWHFVTGSHQQVGSVLAAFGQGVTVPSVGMVGHPQTVYLIGRHGEELAALEDSGDGTLTASYVALITDELRRLL